MYYGNHDNFHSAVHQLCTLPDSASALDITRAFLEVRAEMHRLLDSVDDYKDVAPFQPAGRLIEQLYYNELRLYLLGDNAALCRLLDIVKQAATLLPNVVLPENKAGLN